MLMYLDFEVVFFYLFTLGNSQTQWQFSGATYDKCDDLNPTSNPSLVFAQPQTIKYLPVSDNWIFHARLSAHWHWSKNVVSFGEKNQITVETFAHKYLGISPEFSTNQNYWGCTCPLSSTPLNGQRDINLEKSLQKSKISNFYSWVHQPFQLHHLSIG